MVSTDRLDEGLALLDGVYECGCTLFDTAHIYGNGCNERAVGRWVNSRRVRQKVIIIAKGAHHSRERKRVTPQDITADLTESLDRFGFDYVDLFLLHRDDPDVPVGPIVETLHEHAEAGRIRAFGGSNWTYQRIDEANRYAERHGLRKFVASSPQFSLAVPTRPVWSGCTSISGPQGQAERAWYSRNDIAVICWSSMALGFMTGAITPQSINESVEGYYQSLAVKVFASADNFRRLDRARQLAKEKNVTVAQINLAYILSQPMNVFPLVGCRSVEEFQSNLSALDVRLSDADIAWLELRSDRR